MDSFPTRTRQLRVAHVGTYRPGSPNGVHQVLANMVTRLPSDKVTCEVWHFTPRVRAPETRVVDGVAVTDLPLPRIRPANVYCAPRSTRRWIRERTADVDLLHCHSVFQGDAIFASRQGIPYIVTPHGGYTDTILSGRRSWEKRAWISLWERDFIERARTVHVVSPAEIAEVRRIGAAKRFDVIANAIDVDCPAGRCEGAHLGPWVYMGRLAVRNKGLDLLVLAYAEVSKKCSVPDLVLAGPDFRGGMEALRRLARKAGVAHRIHFQGMVAGDEKWNLLSNASLFIHTSRSDGLPLGLLEAMACGCPVLVSRASNCGDAILEAGAGFMVDPTFHSVAAGLRSVLCRSRQDLSVMGLRAYELVCREYSWPKMSARLVDMYHLAAMQ